MKNVGLVSAIIYTGISLIIAGLFIVATLPGQYTAAERLGGAIWVFLLCMIILMPVVIPLVRKKLQ
ncbi:MAG: hypothetical protein JXA01_01190 [Dehalococcoidia bacterium]|nr:hypothetical protein [Dehalococcoidia bacterium]